MSQAELTTCHCIIGHPDKPKFLVVRHTNEWSVPTVRFEPGWLDYRAKMINEGLKNKYGLKTRVLRSVLNAPNYHCLELELPAGGSSKRLQAVWVGKDEYAKFRDPARSGPDPFALWLEEKERGQVSPLRAPWQKAGWFGEAEHWINFQLDQLGMQITGDVEQYRAGWNASTLLRVPTSQGHVYFKASYAKPPGEVAITLALVDRWPEHTIQPLATNKAKNWMLTADFRHGAKNTVAAEKYPDSARVLSRIQVESSEQIDEWARLGCPRFGLEYLQGSIGNLRQHKALLQSGKVGLSDKELDGFTASLATDTEILQRLSEYQLPETLVHMDFRGDNLVWQDDNIRLIDWADTVIGHPFMALDRMAEYSEFKRAGRQPSRTTMLIDEQQLAQICEAYLDAFTGFEPLPRLHQALALSQQLYRFWSFCQMLHELDWVEPASPRYYYLLAGLQETARWMIAHPRQIP